MTDFINYVKAVDWISLRSLPEIDSTLYVVILHVIPDLMYVVDKLMPIKKTTHPQRFGDVHK